jgi:hypothetical protein
MNDKRLEQMRSFEARATKASIAMREALQALHSAEREFEAAVRAIEDLEDDLGEAADAEREATHV